MSDREVNHPNSQELNYEEYCSAVRDLAERPLETIDHDFIVKFQERVPLTSILAVIGAKQVLEDEDIRQDSLKALTRLMQDEQGRRQLLKMEHLSTIILEGLRHPEPVVRKCTAQLLGRLLQLLREAVTDERDELLAHLITVVIDPPVLQALLELLSDESSSLSQEADSVCIELTKSGEIGVDSVLCQFAVEQLESMSDTDSTILVRIMSLSARMSCVSEYAFAACLRSGFLTKALMTLKQTEDILLQMSAFEVVVETSQSKWGLKFLADSSITEIIGGLLPSATDSLIVCSGLKLLDQLMESSLKFNEISWLQNQAYFQLIEDCLQSEDENVLDSAIGAVCSLCRHESGLKPLFKLVSLVPGFIGRSDVDRTVWAAALHGLAQVLESPEYVNGTQPAQVLRGTPQDVSTPFSILVPTKRLLRDIEIDVRIAVYVFLRAFAVTPYGALSLMDSMPLVDELLDRELEADSKAKPFRFAVIQALAKNPAINSSEFDEARARLLEHVQQGPYYRARETLMVTE